MIPSLDLASSSDAGSGDFFTSTNQTFGGAGSPFRPRTDALIWIVAAVAVVLLLPRLRGLLRGR